MPLRAGGATLRAAPQAPRVAPEGVADLRRFRARGRDVSPLRACWGRSLFQRSCRPRLQFEPMSCSEPSLL
eukprot:15465927-Alexandrium_andersonii.AAC.1